MKFQKWPFCPFFIANWKVFLSDATTGSSLAFEFPFCSVPQPSEAGRVSAVFVRAAVSCYLGNNKLPKGA